jgi:hypothetical protein
LVPAAEKLEAHDLTHVLGEQGEASSFEWSTTNRGHLSEDRVAKLRAEVLHVPPPASSAWVVEDRLQQALGHRLRATRERPSVKKRLRPKNNTSMGEAAIRAPASWTGRLDPP